MAMVAASPRCWFFSRVASPKPTVNALPSFFFSSSSSLQPFRNGVAAANPFIRFPGLRYHASPYSNSTTSEETLPKFSGESDKDSELASDVEEPSLDKDTEAGELLDELKSKVASEESYAILLYGSGALVAVWLGSIIVAAIDSIPLFPQVMEVAGIAFTIWFSYRYMLFKRNRDELVAKLGEIKVQILGSSDD